MSAAQWNGVSLHFRMKKGIIILTFLSLCLACHHRQNCPAYNKGKNTGTEGSTTKARPLFSKKVLKHH